MTRLSVNINKFATLRNARGGNNPDLIQVAQDCESFGAEGITVHPRPDERHIRYQDVLELQKVVQTEFNIEGNPNPRFMELVKKVRPTQATLVPDGPDVLTSDTGWDTIHKKDFLKGIIAELKSWGVRTSIFLNPVEDLVEAAVETGTDRIELYTGPYAQGYVQDPAQAIADYARAARKAQEVGLGVNAGHDLDLKNLAYFKKEIPGLLEVSIGHALICDALYLGLENTIQMYKRALETA